jgi:Flp pilus assembly pilin Flp
LLFIIRYPVSGVGTAFDMRSALYRIWLDRAGAAAVEYAMVALIISIAAFAAIVTIGTDVTGLFTKIASGF